MNINYRQSLPNDGRDQELRDHERRRTDAGGPPQISAVRHTLLWSSIVALAATGAAWLYIQYGYAPAHDEFEANTVQGPLMNLHAAVALVALLLVGSLVDLHVRIAWRRMRNRWSGGLMVAVCTLVTASGYGLWYANGDALHEASELAHWISGFGLPALLLGHLVLGWRSRAESGRKAPA